MKFNLNDRFNIDDILRKLEQVGGVTVSSMLNTSDRAKLLREARGYIFEKRPEFPGTAGVRQCLSAVDKFKPKSLFMDLLNDWNELFRFKLRGSQREGSPFSTPPLFNETSLQQYDVGPIGVTPHRDSTQYVNIICIFNLTGVGKFFLSDNRQGTQNVVNLHDQPGNLILLRAYGFKTETSIPFHALEQITKPRIAVGFRQLIHT